ncbi:IstB domain-containing protein ATP-binding protein [Alicyclobacillus hesperidum URH17-3-68]|nr:IstB domain-containing protein ATP-binding protein [Alicyclobacillus hesperidum URH17-3-68]
MNRAGFPVYKTLEGYERQGVKLPTSLQWSDLTDARFIQAKRNLVLYGPVGTGKTHLATALGVRACELGLVTRFFTVADLVMRLSEAKRGGTLERLSREIARADLLILDEWGYVPVDREGSQLLFRVVADSYESRSLVITTNLEFSKWGSVFTDDQMAAAMIDRLAHHGHLLVFEGESYRMKHALMKQR